MPRSCPSGPSNEFPRINPSALHQIADFSSTLLITLAVVTIVVTLLDYVVPVWGTKKSVDQNTASGVLL
jgi:uncharacterized protein YqgC (DUF456 family)